jgi:hypothetical protein
MLNVTRSLGANPAARSDAAVLPQSPAPAGTFQTRIDAAALALRETNPRFKGASPQYVQGLAEFVSGSMLFVLLHEMAHVSIIQMGLPVPTIDVFRRSGWALYCLSDTCSSRRQWLPNRRQEGKPQVIDAGHRHGVDHRGR